MAYYGGYSYQQPPPQMGMGYQQPGMGFQQPPPPSQHYGSYGDVFAQQAQNACWQAFNFSSEADLFNHFQQIGLANNPCNQQRNAIQAEDLMNVMNNTAQIRNFYGINWSRELCSIMLAMLDRSGDGFMQFSEFLELQACLVEWYKVFQQNQYSPDPFIDAHEFATIVQNLFKYNITAEVLTTILKRYSRVISTPQGEKCVMAFDDFVSASVKLRAFTDAFRKRDNVQHGCDTGNAGFPYDDFLRCTMCL